MNTTDETIFTAQEVNGEEPKAQSDKNNNQTWKQVSIGGVTGILMGAAATYAAESFAATSRESSNSVAGNHTPTDTASASGTPQGVHVAEVDQNLSFGDAFAAARQQVGAGGVFVWQGNLYNTFTTDEWTAMDNRQRQQFAQDVQPMVSVATQARQTTPIEEQHNNNDHVNPEEPDVHFLGVESREIDGQTMNFGMARVDGVNVALVDVDNNQVFDVRWADTNQNGEIERNELSDISQRGMTVSDFATLAQTQQQANGAQTDMVAQQHEDLAPDMPDYMNDADTGLV